jgi:hypothetical protein
VKGQNASTLFFIAVKYKIKPDSPDKKLFSNRFLWIWTFLFILVEFSAYDHLAAL